MHLNVASDLNDLKKVLSSGGMASCDLRSHVMDSLTKMSIMTILKKYIAQ